MSLENPKLVIIIPVFNDWGSVTILLKEITKLVHSSHSFLPQVLLIDDGSTEYEPLLATNLEFPIEIIHLQRNVGHQKAISIGLSYATKEKVFDYAIIMDSDGEDKPEDIENLLRIAQEKKNKIVFAHRAKRNESLRFKLLYKLYKIIFKVLTGVPISFGNFCAIPNALAQRLIYVSEIWNHFSGGIIKSKLPYQLYSTQRGIRYLGKSKMNFQSLVLHGLSSVSVHIDTVSVRLLLASLIFLCVATVLIIFVAGIKLFTQLAIPGWTSNIILGLTLVFLQALFLSVLLVFIILSYRTQKNFIPATDYTVFINHIEHLK